MKKENKVLINNTIMMYVLSIAKLVIPLISLPYLTRVLSIECYGSVSFVKSLMSYFQILIDFGFLLSATKDLIAVIKSKGEINKSIGNTLYAQILLCILSVLILTICCIFLDILDGFVIFAFFSLLTNILSIFLFEYVFKAYEQMGKIAVRYVLMKVLALICTLIFVKSDNDVMLIPLFDAIASIVAIILVAFQMKKLGVKVDFNIAKIKEAWNALKSSFVYFISNFATTAFTALNTVLIGIFLTKTDVSYWSVAMQIISAIQALYSPIINSVFPTMCKNKDLKLIHRIMLIYMPLIFVGCGMILLLGDWAVPFVFGEEYLMTSTILKCLIPLIIISFPAMLYGWPCLGAIDKQKITSITTITAAVVQVIGLVLLALIGQFNVISMALIRGVSELVLCATRMGVVYKNKKLFSKAKNIDENDCDNREIEMA